MMLLFVLCSSSLSMNFTSNQLLKAVPADLEIPDHLAALGIINKTITGEYRKQTHHDTEIGHRK